MATGAKLANQIAEKVYNEAMLTKAWSTTMAAMNNPADRKLGLAALRLNPTLGMHALAWAGGERQPPDPIARMRMDRLGINAQTIAAGATGNQLVSYLKELLHEDRQIERSVGMDDRLPDTNLEWMPPKYTLCARDFFTITRRAAQKASPKLQLGPEKTVLNALKILDKHDPDKLAPLAAVGDVPPEELTKQIEEATFVQTALQGYSPRCADGTVHAEMSNVQAEFLGRASAHVDRLEAIDAQNELACTQAISAVQAELGHISLLPDDTDQQTLAKQVTDSSAVYHSVSNHRVLANRPELKGPIRRLDSDLQRLRDRQVSV